MPADARLLLIKPPYRYYPMGLAYVASTLERAGVAYDYVDTSLQPLNLKQRLEEVSYFAVASGGLVADYFFFETLFQQVKRLAPDMPTLMGGHIVRDISPRVLFAHVPVDYAVHGEAEITLPLFLDRLLGGDKEFPDLRGMIYRNASGMPVRTKSQLRVDLTAGGIMPSLTFFDHHDWPLHDLPIPVLTGRGCFGNCSFCSPAHRSFIPRHFDDIFAEVEFLVRELDIPKIHFQNDIFFSKRSMIKDFCHAYARRFKTTYTCTLRIDMGEILPVIAETGGVAVHIGVESGSDKVLRIMRKNIVTDQTRHFVRKAQRLGMTVYSGFLYNNEGENEEDIRLTQELHEELGITSAFNFTTPYPGTRIFRNACDKGLIHDEYEFLGCLPAIYKSYQHDCHTEGLLIHNERGMPVLPNLTEIPNDRFPEVLRRAAIRFESNYALENPVLAEQGGQTVMRGTCPSCGSVLEGDFDLNRPLSRKIVCSETCPTLFNLHVHLYQLEPFKAHADALSNRLIGAERIVFYGRPEIIRFFLEFNILTIPLTSLKGMATPLAHLTGTHMFRDNHGHVAPVSLFRSIDTIMEMEPDAIIVADIGPFAGRYENDLIAVGIPDCLIHRAAPPNVLQYPAGHRAMLPQALPPVESRLALWPLGAYTRQIVKQGLIDPATIAAFVDGNPDMAGICYAGRTVFWSNDLAGLQGEADGVVVTSDTFLDDILQHIMLTPELRNMPVYVFYGPGSWDAFMPVKGGGA